jgi:hypothetical protein
MAAPFTNAIGWAQYRLLGGPRNLLTTSIAYAVIASTVMFVIVRATPPPRSITLDYCTKFLLFIQVLVLLVYGTMRVGAAVRADVRSRMIESHRLMPAPSLGAVLGYLFGPTVQAVILFVLNCLLGAVAVAGAALPSRWWLVANAVLLCFSVFLWSMLIFFSFRSGAARTMAVLGIVGLIFPPIHMLLILISPLHVLVTPLIGNTIFDPRFGLADTELIAGASGLQLLFIALYLIASARRYRSDDVIAFDPLLALGLLAGWLGACALSIMYPDRLLMYFGMPTDRFMPPEVSLVESLVLMFLLAILPVSSATRLVDDPVSPTRRRSLPPVLSVLAAALLALQLAHFAPIDLRTRTAVLRTLIVAISFLLSIRYLLGLSLRFGRKTRQLVVLWLAGTWVVPVAIELILQSFEPPGPAHMSQIGMCSPMGELYQIWSRDPHVHSAEFTGLAVQVAAAIFLGAIYHVVRRRKTGKLMLTTVMSEPAATRGTV